MVGKKDTKGTSFPVFLPVPFLAQSLSPSLSFFPVAQPLSYRSSVLQQKGGEPAWCSWLAASPKLRCASWRTSIINLSASLVRAWHIYSLRLSPSLPVSPSPLRNVSATRYLVRGWILISSWVTISIFVIN